MADAVVLAWRKHHETAVTQVRQFLDCVVSSPKELKELTTTELQAYRSRRVISGWRLNVEFSDCVRRLDVLLDYRFPHTPPHIALVDRPAPLTWPHIDEDGVLCLLLGSTTISYTAPVEVVQNLLRAAVELIEQCAAGLNHEDFRNEFLSYWGRATGSKAIEFRSLVTPGPPSREIRVWRGRLFYLLSDDEPAARSWLQNFFQEVNPQSWNTEPAALLWLDHPLHPREYPRAAADVWALARERTVDGLAVLESVVAATPEIIVALLKVAIIGCGSVGGPIALKLAQAGVGHLILIDPERVVWANVGQQPHGAKQVGQFKAVGLAAQIKADYPHVSLVEAYACCWEELALQNPEIINTSDLLISTTGSWHAEGALNEWHLAHGRYPTIVYGWTESYACAGHAVAIMPQGGCLQCGLSEWGEPFLRVTDWPTRDNVIQEPACGVVYQPYGPIELAHIETLIEELALDCLLDTVHASQHRVWAARRSVLEAADGRWNPTWAETMPGHQQGGCVYERPWPVRLDCPACQAGVNA